jgi:hypothetical protein
VRAGTKRERRRPRSRRALLASFQHRRPSSFRSAATRSAILFAQASARPCQHGRAVVLFACAFGSRLTPSPTGPPTLPRAIPAWPPGPPPPPRAIPARAVAIATTSRVPTSGRRRRPLAGASPACPVAGSGRPLAPSRRRRPLAVARSRAPSWRL